AFLVERCARLLKSSQRLQRESAVAEHGCSQLYVGSALSFDANALVQQLETAPRYSGVEHRDAPVVQHDQRPVALLAAQFPVLADGLLVVALGLAHSAAQAVRVADGLQQRGFGDAAIAALAGFLRARAGVRERFRAWLF